MTLSDWLAIAAMIIAPILAVQVQKIIESIKETRNRKMKIFKTLMATRATPLSPAHVESLNLIDIEFYKEKRVIETWQLLHDNFSNYPKDPNASDYEIKVAHCNEKASDLLTDLLYEMSRVLRYNFDKVLLKRGWYNPKSHGDYQLEQDFIRRGLINVLWGNKPIPISISGVKQLEQGPTQIPSAIENQEEN